MAKANLQAAVDALWEKPSEENWKKFAKTLPMSGLKYYKVVYQKGKLQRAQDLTKSYAQLYDSKQRPVLRVPIFEKRNGKVTGATYYIKGLLAVNKPDEWIK
ncbi:MAG: hypothetical protein M1158_02020 [Candidatus Marsarchaeota archaeon]|jgi:hypothetical protein|nr:hypothetical protein [Candidatus Marsarchaeota archaeon]